MWLNTLPVWQRKLIRPFLTELRTVHESETDWVGWDFDHVIDNTGSLDDLTSLVLEWYKTITPQ
jgi:hypothetical protein